MTQATIATYSAHSTPKQGDKIIVAEGSAVSVTTVRDVTKTGQFYLEGDRRRWKMCMSSRAARVDSRYNKSDIEVYPYSDDKLKEVEQVVTARKAAHDAKRAEKEAARERRENEVRLQTEHVQSLIAFDTIPVERLPDGSRIYRHTFTSRIQPAPTDDAPEATVEAGWVFVVITCREIEGRDWDTNLPVTMIESAFTYLTERHGSFSSAGSERYSCEEAAVAEALRYTYFKAW